jgi:hypothetical protein
VHTEREAITGRVDLVHRLVDPRALETDHVQHRPEDLALKARDAVDLDRERREPVPARQPCRQPGAVMPRVPPDDRRRVRLERRAGVRVDGRAHVARE